MLDMNLKAIFTRSVIAVSMLALTGSTIPLSTGDENISAGQTDVMKVMSIVDEVCFPAGVIRNPRAPIVHYISDMYRMTAGGLGGDVHKICMDRTIDSTGKANTNGTVRINPDFARTRETMALTMRHELRHLEPQQVEIADLSDHIGEKNIPEWHHVMMRILREADAHMSEVAFAHRMERNGHPEYAQEIRSMNLGDDELSMLESYEKSFNRDGAEDVPAAMRAAVLDFLASSKTKGWYLKKISSWAPHIDWKFNPGEKTHDLMGDEYLHLLGRMDGFSYMENDEFKDAVRRILSEKAYVEAVRQHIINKRTSDLTP